MNKSSVELSREEIALLREEALQSTNHAIEITNYAVTASGVLIGAGFSITSELAGLIPLAAILLLISYQVLLRQRRFNTIRISTYLRAFAGDAFLWEERLNRLRKHKVHTRRASFARSIFYVLTAMQFACCCLGSEFKWNRGG